MAGVGAPAYLAPADFVRTPEALDRVWSPAESLRLLAWWRGELDAMYQGRATNPVFAALGPTIAQYGIPRHRDVWSNTFLSPGSLNCASIHPACGQ